MSSIYGFCQNEYYSITNKEMGSTTLDFGKFLPPCPAWCFTATMQHFDILMRGDLNFNFRRLDFSLFRDQYSVSIFCHFDILFSIFCQFDILHSIFCPFNILSFDILSLRHFAASIHLRRYFAA